MAHGGKTVVTTYLQNTNYNIVHVFSYQTYTNGVTVLNA